VPTYQYTCTQCSHAFEQFQSFSDDALTVCPECEGRLRKVYNAVGVVFKGSGFYRTDSRTEATAGSGAGNGGGNGSNGTKSTSDSPPQGTPAKDSAKDSAKSTSVAGDSSPKPSSTPAGSTSAA
jgi:putative FmdB family regulatory protein